MDSKSGNIEGAAESVQQPKQQPVRIIRRAASANAAGFVSEFQRNRITSSIKRRSSDSKNSSTSDSEDENSDDELPKFFSPKRLKPIEGFAPVVEGSDYDSADEEGPARPKSRRGFVSQQQQWGASDLLDALRSESVVPSVVPIRDVNSPSFVFSRLSPVENVRSESQQSS